MQSPRSYKTAAYEHLAEIGKALSDPTRVEILDYVAQAARSVEEIAQAVGHTTANTSHHLQALKKARLVVSHADGPRRIYELSGHDVSNLVDALYATSYQHLAALRELTEEFFGERDGLEPIDAGELMRRLADEDAVLIDVRPEAEYETSHIPGALSVPVGELSQHLDKLPKTRTVVAYCRGPFCVFSADAVRMLREQGFDAVRYDGSVSAARSHWEQVYDSKSPDSVSWYRPHLDRSLEYIERADLPTDARMVDIGGGASTWPDDLLSRGYDNLAVVDISSGALERSRARLGDAANAVDWIVGDAREPQFSDGSVDLWHDRAVLHFMTGGDAVAYRDRLAAALKPGGFAVIATFAPDGPKRCSGLDVTQYSADSLLELLGPEFSLVTSTEDIHETPWGSEQKFMYALVQKS